MPSEDDRVARRLLDIVENIDKAKAFVGAREYGQFLEDEVVVYAVERALEIISEAARHVPEEIMNRYGHIEWRQIKAAGNVYRHSYKDVSLDIVWDTVRLHLSSLRDAAVIEIERLGYGSLLPK